MKRIVKKPSERRAEIVKAARDLFLQKEYDRTTVEDVMEHLGIAKGTIYHYFVSKEALLEAVIDEMVNARIADIESMLEKSKEKVLTKIKKVIALGNMAKENPHLLAPLHRPKNAGMHIRIFTETLIKLTPIYEKLIQQGCEEGIFKTDYPCECAEFILSAVHFLMDTGIHPWTKEELVRRAKALPRLIEQLLQAPPGSFQF